MSKKALSRFKAVRDHYQNPAETEKQIHELLAGAQVLSVRLRDASERYPAMAPRCRYLTSEMG